MLRINFGDFLDRRSGRENSGTDPASPTRQSQPVRRCLIIVKWVLSKGLHHIHRHFEWALCNEDLHVAPQTFTALRANVGASHVKRNVSKSPKVDLQ
jgi:hypothetical protein